MIGAASEAGAVTIVSPMNLPSSMAEHASYLYARNVAALLDLLTDEAANLRPDFDDEIVASACITRDGAIVHAGAKATVDAVRETELKAA